VPLFHSSALCTFILRALYWDAPVVLGIGDRPLTPDSVIAYLDNSRADSVMLPPSILEEMSKMDEGIEALRKLKFVAFGGGKSQSGATKL
jgi:hypothetical protein